MSKTTFLRHFCTCHCVLLLYTTSPLSMPCGQLESTRCTKRGNENCTNPLPRSLRRPRSLEQLPRFCKDIEAPAQVNVFSPTPHPQKHPARQKNAGTPVKRFRKETCHDTLRRTRHLGKAFFFLLCCPLLPTTTHIQPINQSIDQSIDRTTNFSAIASCVLVRLLRYETMSKSWRLSSKRRLNASGRIRGTAASVSASCRATRKTRVAGREGWVRGLTI